MQRSPTYSPSRRLARSLVPSGLLILVCVVAAVVPLFGTKPATAVAENFPGWPTHFEGRPLRTLPLGPLEQRFAAGFPGRIARFSDGEREIVFRWISRETRLLHPASDCFRGVGFSVTPQPLRVDPGGERWGGFIAARGGNRLSVSERIHDERGNQWTDVSSWYWAATTGESRGPWWAVTFARSLPTRSAPPSQRMAESPARRPAAARSH
jgi:hypothetical protein